MNSGTQMIGILKSLLCFALTAACVSCAPFPKSSEPPSSGLLRETREDARKNGSAVARDHLSTSLVHLDASHGAFEQRIWATNADKAFTYPDAIWHLTANQRARLGIYFSLGYGQLKGRSPQIIKAAAEELGRRGFRARVIPAPEHGTTEENAKAIASYVRADSPNVDAVMFIGFSKGAADIQEFLTSYGQYFPKRDRAKFRIWVNFAGVLRGSCVADWLVHDNDPLIAVFRTYLSLQRAEPFQPPDGLHSIAHDPWRSTPAPNLRSFAGHLRVINFPVLPDESSGYSHHAWQFRLLEAERPRRRLQTGPCDGVVEAAATVLPPEAGLPQWIVRVSGSHHVLDGRYLNGAIISPGYAGGETARLASGIPLMSDILRALPKSALGL